MLTERDKNVLSHILNYIVRIEQNTNRFGNTEKIFLLDNAYQETDAFCLLQIGELVSRLSEDFKSAYTQIPWTQIKALRNIVAHGYGTIDKKLIWKTIQNDVPHLKSYINEIISEEHNAI